MRMLSVSGIDLPLAVSAMGATGLLSTWVLFALPAVSLLVSLVGSPVPQGMGHVAWGGAAVFVLMFLAGLAVTRSDWLLETVGPWIERANRSVMRRLGRSGGVTVAELEEQRDEMVRTLGGKFRQALFVAVGNWLLDYLVLVTALLAIGSEPKLSLVLLAYAVSAVLGMIPITPGGLGFVRGRPHRHARPRRGAQPGSAARPPWPTGCSASGCRCPAGLGGYIALPAPLRTARRDRTKSSAGATARDG